MRSGKVVAQTLEKFSIKHKGIKNASTLTFMEGKV